MRELRTRELRRLLDAILILNENLDAATLPARAMAAAHKVVSNDLVCFGDIDLANHRIVHAALPHDPRVLPGHPVWERFMQLIPDPVMAHFARTGDLTPRKFSDFLSDRQFRSTALYADFFREVGMRAQMAVPFNDPDPSKRLVGVSVSRSRGDFDESDRACLAVLRTHAAQAIRNANGFALLCSKLQQTPVAAAAPLGGSLFAVAVAEPTKGSPRHAAVTPSVPLTKRESEVLYWAGIGKTNGEIAVIIGAASGTVKKHLEHVYEKLAVRNRTAAAQYVTGALHSPEK